MPAIRTEAYKPDVRRIVTVDGEGQTVNGRHAYVLLAAADDRGFRAYVEHDGTERPAARYQGDRFDKTHYHALDTAPNHGLPTKRMLDFLLDIPEGNSDLVISFSFTYDITKILMDLPWYKAREFAANAETIGVEWEGYRIAGIPRKFFDVWKGDKHVRVWDTFTYWQMSFAKALNASLSLFSDKQREMIKTIEIMKRERAHFDVLSDDDIREYCFNECECLSVMYRDFLRHVDAMNITQRAHSGPGSAATAVFDEWNITAYMPEGHHSHVLSNLPPDVAKFSYYGGRFEISQQGEAGDLIEYDIQSAYPAIAVTLPCLRCGRFRHVTEYEPGKMGFYFVGSRTSGPWAPFPFRSNAVTGRELMNGAGKGSIAFAHGGKRWVTSAEVETARKYFGAEAIPVYDGYVYDVGCTHKSPFAALADLYLIRKVGQVGCPACEASPEHFCDKHPAPSEGLSKLIKLIINSVYGKLAQGIGWTLDPDQLFSPDLPESYKPPKFQCYIWAAWITGGTRAKVMEAAFLGGRKADCPECHDGEMFRACDEHASVVSIATDGILTSQDIPELPVTDYQLGTWERAPKPNAWLGMPGIYSFYDAGKPETCSKCRDAGAACEEHANAKKFKRRGLDSRYFPAHYLRDAWAQGLWRVDPYYQGGADKCSECARLNGLCDEHAGDLTCPECIRIKHACGKHRIRAFMPLRLAVTRTNGLDVMGEWIPMSKQVTFRSVEHKRNYEEIADDDFLMGHGASIKMYPFTFPDDARSTPYEPKATWNETRVNKLDDPDMVMFNEFSETDELLEMMNG